MDQAVADRFRRECQIGPGARREWNFEKVDCQPDKTLNHRRILRANRPKDTPAVSLEVEPRRRTSAFLAALRATGGRLLGGFFRRLGLCASGGFFLRPRPFSSARPSRRPWLSPWVSRPASALAWPSTPGERSRKRPRTLGHDDFLLYLLDEPFLVAIVFLFELRVSRSRRLRLVARPSFLREVGRFHTRPTSPLQPRRLINGTRDFVKTCGKTGVGFVSIFASNMPSWPDTHAKSGKRARSKTKG